jgi:hypothetical protein
MMWVEAANDLSQSVRRASIVRPSKEREKGLSEIGASRLHPKASGWHVQTNRLGRQFGEDIPIQNIVRGCMDR